jgi:putative IMPACT (imprinted ancient) family translation regulator
LLVRLDFQLICGYEQWQVVEPALLQQGVNILETTFTDNVTVRGRVVEAEFATLQQDLIQLCHGRLQIDRLPGSPE